MRRLSWHIWEISLPLLLLTGARARAEKFYVADNRSGTIDVISDSGLVSTYASNVPGANGLACDVEGNWYTLDLNHGRVYKIAKTGVVSILANGLRGPEALAFNSRGDLYVACMDGTVARVSRLGVVSTLAKGLGELYGLTIDADDNVYVSDHTAGTIFRITKMGAVTTYADANAGAGANTFSSGTLSISTGTLGSSGSLILRSGVSGLGVLAMDAHGNLYAAAQNSNAIYKVEKSGAFTQVAGGINSPADMAFDSHGDLYVASSSSGMIYKVNSSGGLIGYAAGLGGPLGLAAEHPLYKLAAGLTAREPATDTTPRMPVGYVIAFCAPAAVLVVAALVWVCMRKRPA